ncbi:antirestriction protein ArdA [Mammaliicoccus sp. JADD-157]|uniref:antirestriction protein ArdA n=1 Tax=Mammaliicoccus sp. JADD-157 TaxID=3404818 RepID=UPI003BB633DA
MTNNVENYQAAIYLTNLGKYNEGALVGQWLNVPCTNEEFKQALLNIGVDGVEYEEYFITDYEYLKGISEYSNIEEVNEIAVLSKTIEDIVSNTIGNEYNVFDSDKDFIRNSLYDRASHLKQYDNLTQDEIIEELESYTIFTEHSNENCNALESYGYYLLEELDVLSYSELDQEVKNFLDVEKIGFEYLINQYIEVIDTNKVGNRSDHYSVIIVQI